MLASCDRTTAARPPRPGDPDRAVAVGASGRRGRRACAWTTSTGGAARSPSAAKATGTRCCRCRPTSAKRSWPTCVDARPATDAREVFLRVPGPASGADAGRDVRSSRPPPHAGPDCPPVHAHRLRHTAATAMLRGGASLAEVGQVLRHRHALTTAIYAKVDSEGAARAGPPVAGGVGVSRAARGARRLPGAAPGAGIPARPRGEAARPVPRLSRAARRRGDHHRRARWPGRRQPNGDRLVAPAAAVGGARVRHLPARPRPEAPRCRRRICCPAGTASHPLPVLRRRDRAVIAAARALPHPDAAPPPIATLIGLLAVTGIRVGEAIASDRDDLDQHPGRADGAARQVRQARLLPLHPSTVDALRDYLRLPRPAAPDTGHRRAVRLHGRHPAALRNAGSRSLQPAGPPGRAGRRVGDLPSADPRPAALIRRRAPCSTPTATAATSRPGCRCCRPTSATPTRHTYWYLDAAPELLAIAADRLETHIRSDRS